MSWIVRNTLRGTLELHGFLPGGQPVRIPGKGSFDLDCLPVKREALESSRQLQVAFQEGYLKTETRNDEISESVSLNERPLELTLVRWQTDIQNQLNDQARQLDSMNQALTRLVDKITGLSSPPQGEGNVSLDVEALQGILKNENQRQVEVLKRVLKEDQGGQIYLTEQEAQSRARMIEHEAQTMELDFDAEATVVRIDAKTNNDDKVDLLSGLGDLED